MHYPKTSPQNFVVLRFVFNNIYEMNQGTCQMLNYLQWYVTVPPKKKLQFNIKLCALNLRNFSFKFARAP